MTPRSISRLAVLALCTMCTLTTHAKDVRDTLFSSGGDRVIIDYSIQSSGGQTTLRFNSIQKKLGTEHQRKYKKLDEVAVVIFDRTGTYNDVKFDGMTPQAFMLPAGVQYNFSSDGYFLLQDNPQLQFSGTTADISIPLYLAHYEKKRHYKIFSQCGTLQFNTKVSGGGGARSGRSGGGGAGARSGDHAANADDIITSEEISDEGLTPVDDALITIASVNNTLAGVTKLPFPEDLTFQANHLRELRSKISDMAVLEDINKVLAAYDKKKADLEESAASDQAAAAAAQQQAAQAEAAAQQARQDSIQAAQEKKSADEKKDMMWLIGGIAGIGMLLMFGKQIFQTIKNNKMQKMMMDNISKVQQQAMANVNIPGMENNPMAQEINQQVKREAQKSMNQQTNAAKDKLDALTKGKESASTTSTPSTAPTPSTPPTTPPPAAAAPATPGKRPLRKASEVKAAAGITGSTITPGGQQSLNDAIPAKYKRWRKPGASGGAGKADA